MLKNLKNYFYYREFVETGRCLIKTSDITFETWGDHFNGILNILKDGIELEFVQSTPITIDFGENRTVDLYVPDYFFNLIMWYLIVRSKTKIQPKHLFFEESITRKSIKRYIDEHFIEENRKKMSNIELNNIIDDAMYLYSHIDNFAMYLANTINLEDNIKMMQTIPEFNQIINADLSNIPIEDVKNIGMDMTNKVIKYIKDSKKYIGYDHCLADSLRASEGINPKQFKEFAVNIGSKPNGQGGVFPSIINKSFLTGGVNDLLSYFIESSTGRIAQILSKNNVGESGHFARLLGLNNTDTFLHDDPTYACDSQNYQILYIANKDMLEMLKDRYYRFHPNGMEYIIKLKDKHLIGQTILLRSPMTCSSHSRGFGVCYRCYGDLAYTNNDINIGKIAAEEISSKLTQILLSAKHLLETVIKKIKWPDYFYNLFEIDGNIIKLTSSEFNFKNYYLVIDPETIDPESKDEEFSKDEFEELEKESTEENIESYECISNFYVLTNTKDTLFIMPTSEDATNVSLYISKELNEIINKRGKLIDGKLYTPMTELDDVPLFFIPLHNNELSKTMSRLMDTINKNSITKNRDRNQLLQEFDNIIIEGGLNVSSVHCEIILMNQIRSFDNVLEIPQWQYPNEPCNILTLNQALTDNPSITVSLLYQRLSKLLYTPLTYKKIKPSYMDLFFMEAPQNYLSGNNYIKPSSKPVEKETNLVKPIVKLTSNKAEEE